MRPLGRIYTVVPPAFDRRRTPRRAARHIGQILTEPTAAPQHCLVIQESDGGVRIQITADLPYSAFILRFAGTEARYKVIWRKGHTIGAELLVQGAPDTVEDSQLD
jgi:hypothetical protein